MSNVEKQLARAEAIIEALITENGILKAKIAQLESLYGSATNSISTHKIEGGSETDFISTIKSEGGTETHSISINKSEGGTGTRSVSIPKSEGGTEILSVSTIKSEGGTEMHSVSTLNSGEGTAMFISELPNTLDPALYRTVATALKQAGITGVPSSYLLCVAQLIIHFHNGSPSDYPTLLKLTSLSRGGLSKNMASMRKRGIIIKAGFQRYAITEWSRGILRKVVMK